MATVTYIGLEELHLSSNAKATIRARAERHAEKIAHAVKGDVVVHVKEHHRAGKRHQYEVLVRANTPHPIPASATDWDIFVALKHGFESLEQEVKHLAHA